MKNKNTTSYLYSIPFILGLFLYFKYEDFALMILCFLISPFIILIITYIEFEKITSGNDYIMLSKKSVKDWKWGFFIMILVIGLKDITAFSIILMFLVAVYAFLTYTISKRRTFIINTSGVKELNIQQKKRDISEITHFDIYGNNVEMRFNHDEILQINKSELLYPKWDTFISQMNELELYIKLNNTEE